jgi:hypothetical protein
MRGDTLGPRARARRRRRPPARSMAIPITTPLRTLAPRPFQSGACQTLAVSLAPRPSEPLVVALSRNNRAAKSAGIEFCDRQAHKQSASPNRGPSSYLGASSPKHWKHRWKSPRAKSRSLAPPTGWRQRAWAKNVDRTERFLGEVAQRRDFPSAYADQSPEIPIAGVD